MERTITPELDVYSQLEAALARIASLERELTEAKAEKMRLSGDTVKTITPPSAKGGTFYFIGAREYYA